MNPISKQRLVGSLLLMGLAVVFWPIIFVQPIVNRPINLSAAPAPPVIDASPLAGPQSPRAKLEPLLIEPKFDEGPQIEADENTHLADTEENSRSLDERLTRLPNVRTFELPSAESKAPAAVELNAEGLPNSWVLQVAAVKSRQRATQLVKALQAKGYEAFSRKVTRGDLTLWRIQIGPKLEQAKLVNLKPTIDELFEVNATILRYGQQ